MDVNCLAADPCAQILFGKSLQFQDKGALHTHIMSVQRVEILEKLLLTETAIVTHNSR
jgi:hypothetical protein